MAKINVLPKYKEIYNSFDKLAGSKAMWQIFSDFIEMTAMSIQNSVEAYPARWEKNEQQYMNICKGYTREEMESFSEIYGMIMRMLEDNPNQDLLGDLYMQLGLGSSELGQFFTPYSVSKMMADVTIDIDYAKKKIAENGVLKINEPAIGGGANIIACLNKLRESGIDYQREVIVVGQDLSAIGVYMSYIVLSLMGASAVIKIDDTLCKPYTSFYDEIKNGGRILYTPMFVLTRGFRNGII